MTDLPIVSPPAVPATIAHLSRRGAPARDATLQPGTSPFQDALALEMGLAPDGAALAPDASALAPDGALLAPDAARAPRPGMRAATARAGNSGYPGQDAAQSAAAADAARAPAGAATIPIPPAPATTAKAKSILDTADDAGKAAVTDAASPAPAGAALFLFVPVPAAAPRLTPGAPAPARPSPAFAPTGAPAAAAAPEARTHRTGKAGAAPGLEAKLQPGSAAADIAAPGEFALPAEAAIRREDARDTRAPEQHQPMAAPAIQVADGAPAAAAPVHVAALEARVGAGGWDQGLGDKLIWMAGQKHQVAELHLNPPELGPLKITLTLNHDQASAQFVSAHPAVREALEAAMPRLREMLADSGITLGNASVGADAFREQAQPQQQPRAYAGAPDAAPAAAGVASRGELLLRRSLGLVDTFV